jgi:hypothetical protein
MGNIVGVTVDYTTGFTDGYLNSPEGFDDSYYEIPLPNGWSVNFLGRTYNSIFIGTNSYVTFGGGSNENYITPPILFYPAITIAAGDNSMKNYYYGLYEDPNRGVLEFRIRYEGWNGFGQFNLNPNQPGIIWELVLTEGDPDHIQIIADTNRVRNPGGVYGVSDGTKWVEQFSGLPIYNNYGEGFDSIIVNPITYSSANKVKYLGGGITTQTTGDTVYVKIDPLEQYNINLNLSDFGTVISSSLYGMTLTTGQNGSPIIIAPYGNILLQPEQQSDTITDGYETHISGGDYASNTIIPTNGGGVQIRGGQGSQQSTGFTINSVYINNNSTTIVTTNTINDSQEFQINNNDKIIVNSVSGTTLINNKTFYVSVINSNTLKLYLDKNLRVPFITSGDTEYGINGIFYLQKHGGDVSIIGGGARDNGDYGNVNIGVGNKQWTFNQDGNLINPNYRYYSALLTQTAPQTLTNYIGPLGLIVGETYIITDYISGDDFSNMEIISGDTNTTGCVFKATSSYVNNWNYGSTIVSSGNLIVTTLENTFDVDFVWSIEMGAYVCTPSYIGNTLFQTNKTIVKVSTTYPYGYYSYPPIMSGFVYQPENDQSYNQIVVLAFDYNVGYYVPDQLYNTPVEIISYF